MKHYSPTSASRRALTVVTYKGTLTTRTPHKALVTRLKSHAGRNNQGRITTRHQGSGNTIRYREIDFKQNKIGVRGVVETIEYDPYRTGFIALVRYADGARKYILAPQELKVGDMIITSPDAPCVPGNRTLLSRIPVGTFVYNVELQPGRGGQLGRAGVSSLIVLANEEGYTHLKMPSGEIRKVLWNCYASLGNVSNKEHNLVVIGKAGRSRWLGIRPTVRGKVMNPRDHPYGGGEGRTQRGLRRQKTKWGKITGGRKTRRAKNRSNVFIVSRRPK